MTKGILKMPRLGETMEQGRIIGWLVAPGQAFHRGDALVEVETDKTVVEFPALGPGTLIETLMDKGDMVEIGTPIAKVDTGDGPDWTVNADSDGSDDVISAQDTPVPPKVSSAVAAENRAEARPRATPVARRLARMAGIDIAEITGTGRRGRVERRDVEQALDEMTSGHDAVLHQNGIAYVDRGAAGGAPVLLLHGFAADHTIWSGLISGLIKRGAHVVAPDLPAHGETQVEAVQTGDLAAGLAPFTSSIFGEKPLHLVAHSLGAVPAVALGEHLHLRSLTLIAPAGLGTQINGGFVDGLAHAKSPEAVATLLGQMTDGAVALSPSAIDRFYHSLQKNRLTGIAAELLGKDGGQPPDIKPALTRLAEQIPVRIIVGHRDQIVGWSDAPGVSPRIAVHHLPQAGHMPHWEELPAVLDILKGVINPAG